MCFHLGQRLGWDILPRHFYSEIPDINLLRRTTSWRKPYSLVGVRGVDPAEQKSYLERFVTPELTKRFYLRLNDSYERMPGENGEEGLRSY